LIWPALSNSRGKGLTVNTTFWRTEGFDGIVGTSLLYINMQDDFPPDAPSLRRRLSRRWFLERAARTAVLLSMARVTAAGVETKPKPMRPFAGRLQRALKLRAEAAQFEMRGGIAAHVTNTDEQRHERSWICYSKGLPHTSEGEADAAAYAVYAAALASGRSQAFEEIPLGGYLKLANPQAAFAYDLLGPDSHQITIPPPPEFASAAQAAELVELYWQALTRDVAFSDYATNSLIAEAATELSALNALAGPREQRGLTGETIFRGDTRGGRSGPYVSQFLWRDLPWIPIRVPQRIRIATPNKDFLTSWDQWLAIQNGGLPLPNTYEEGTRYIRNGRDLAEFAHRDFTYQAFLGACLMLFRMSAPVDGGIPYQYSVTQSGFVTFGPSDILHLLAVVANIALKAAWFHKWLVHRRLRPEEYAARVHMHRRAGKPYPLHLDLLNSRALERIVVSTGTALLPQAYPEGSPLHPSYPSGHAVIAGACVTVLKACFAETFVIPDPVVPSADGISLQPYRGGALTVGSELDKLAENMSFGRNFGGIHWRTDATAGIRLGEEVAIRVLAEMKITSSELFRGFSLTRFDGRTMTI
jgi:hypothetical protein